MSKRPKLVSVAIALLLAISATAFVLHQAGSLPYRVYVVHTGSMIPTIPPESVVVVREGEYHVGEVISFVEHGNVVSHRLMAIHPNGTITTKGDGNRTADPWHVPVSHIIRGAATSGISPDLPEAAGGCGLDPLGDPLPLADLGPRRDALG